MRIFHDIEVPHKELDYETVYLDEFKGNADKEKYQLAIYDTNHILIDILKDRKSSTIREFLLCHKDSIKKGWNGHVYAVQEYSILLFSTC